MDGSSAAMTSLLGGQVMIAAAMPSDFIPQVKANRVKIIAVATEEREAVFPDIPTLKEQGIDFSNWGSVKGIALPKGTPTEVNEYFNDLFGKICADPELEQDLMTVGLPINYIPTEEYIDFFASAQLEYKVLIESLELAYYQTPSK